jgi:hypothetical protein
MQTEQSMPAEARPLQTGKITKTGTWLYGIWKKLRWITDGCLVMMATPDDLRSASRASRTQEKKFPLLWNKLIDGMEDETVFRQVRPHTFEVRDGLPVVWLADQDELLYVAMQAKYLDYLLKRYPTAVLLAKEPKWGILVRVWNRGVKNVVAIIMPLEADYQPNDREDWDEVVWKGTVPTMDQGPGGETEWEPEG